MNLSEKSLALVVSITMSVALAHQADSAEFIKPDIVVATDGNGGFTTIQTALESIPTTNRERTVILIKDGVYHEKVRVDAPFVTLRGQSRNGSGFSTTDIVTIIQRHDKTHLVGANNLDAANALHTVTLHHEWFINPWDRLPRLRGGNVHDYNIYVDDTVGWAAKQLRDSRTIDSQYSFNPFLNGSISTESGAVLVEKSVYIDCITPLRNNQTNPSDPTYTGKIMALDTIYHFDNLNGSTTDYRGDSTNSTGMTDFGPAQAPVIAFSWNLTNNVLLYIYYPDDPARLKSIVTSPTHGAGAGVLTWNKTNWLVTSYAPTGTVIVSSPQDVTNSAGQTVTFTVVAGGSAPLGYQWYFNTNTPIANATSSSLTLTNIQAVNAGDNSVVETNPAGIATSAQADLVIPPSGSPFQTWQQQNFGCTNCAGSAATDDPDGDGLNNLAEFLAGSDPTSSSSGLRILSAVPQGGNVVITWLTSGGGRTNAVQASAGDGSGNYSNGFADISTRSSSPPMPSTGQPTT